MMTVNGRPAACSNCRFYQPLKGLVPGQCRYVAPVAVPQPTYFIGTGIVASITYPWPVVSPDDWCAYFQEPQENP